MMDTIERGYEFFDHLVVVESDSHEVARALDAIYSRQRAPLPAKREDVDLRVRVVSRAAAPVGARIEVGGRTIRVADPAQLVHYAHLVLINAAASLVRDALVLHSGAVCRDGRSAILVGSSGRGKTTLTVELVRRGWQFQSDDFAVLGTDGIVRAFPRRVNLTDQSLVLLGLSAPTGSVRVTGFGGREKWLIDIDDLFPGRLVDEARLGAVFLLGRGPSASAGAADDSAATWELELDHVPKDLSEALAQLAGVQSVVWRESDREHSLRVVASPGAFVVPGIDQVCADFDVTVMSARRISGDPKTGSPQEADGPSGHRSEGSGRSSRRAAHSGSRRGSGQVAADSARNDSHAASGRGAFQSEPAVSELTSEEALPELLGHALSLSGRRYFGGTSHEEVLRAVAQLHAVLARAEAPLYRLGLGPVTATADAIEATMAAVASADRSRTDPATAG